MDGIRGGVFVGKGGDSVGTKRVDIQSAPAGVTGLVQNSKRVSDPSSPVAPSSPPSEPATDVAREALRFFFSKEGGIFREFLLEEICNGVDAISRDALREIVVRIGIRKSIIPPLFRAMAPKLTSDDRKVVDSMIKLINFLTDELPRTGSGSGAEAVGASTGWREMVTRASRPETRERLVRLLPTLQEFAPSMQQFGQQIVTRLLEKSAARVLRASADAIFGESPRFASSSSSSSLPTVAVAAA